MRVNSVSGNFVVLDRLRGIAALLVLVDHAGCILLGRDLVPRNLLAVQFFFMLSGFVVACGYDAKLEAGMSARGFLLRRAIRLYPLLLLGAGSGAGALWIVDPAFAADPEALISVLMAMLCVPISEAGFGFGRFPINPPEWSLFFEIAANVGFATLVPLIPKRALVAVAAGATLIYAALTTAFWPGSVPFWCEGIGATGAFCAGIALWRGRLQWPKAFPSAHRRLPGGVLSVILAAICMSPISLGPLLTPLASFVLFPVIILAGAANGRSKNGSAVLGAMSYPLYILHWPMLLLAREWLIPVTGPELAVPLACAIAFCCAGIALKTFDLPMRTMLARQLLAPGPTRPLRVNPTSKLVNGAA